MGLITSLASILGDRADTRVAYMSLAELNSDGSPIAGNIKSFQYFPESISDSRSVDWNEKKVVGGSHPIYQWTSGNARTISFQSIFTCDVAPPTNPNGNPLSAASQLQDIGATVSTFAKNPVASAIGTLKGATSDPYTTNIPAAIAWLRAKTYPLYKNNVAQAPPKLLLVMPNSGIVSQVNAKFVDSVPVVMVNCNVVYESFFRTGYPRVVTVDLEFVEIVQLGSANWGFVSRDTVNQLWYGKYTLYNNNFVNSAIAPTKAPTTSLLNGQNPSVNTTTPIPGGFNPSSLA
jgi:hypothetical protein